LKHDAYSVKETHVAAVSFGSPSSLSLVPVEIIAMATNKEGGVPPYSLDLLKAGESMPEQPWRNISQDCTTHMLPPANLALHVS